MSDKVLEFNGSETLPHSLKVNIQMEMPYELAVKILDLIQKNMPAEPVEDLLLGLFALLPRLGDRHEGVGPERE